MACLRMSQTVKIGNGMHTMALYVILPLAMALVLRLTGALLVVSCAFSCWCSLHLSPLLLCLATDWLILAFLHRYHSQRFRRVRCLSVVKNLLVILVLETLLQMNRRWKHLGAWPNTPLAVPEYTGTQIYVYLYLLYCCFFPAGGSPLLPYRDFAPAGPQPHSDRDWQRVWAAFARGCHIVCWDRLCRSPRGFAAFRRGYAGHLVHCVDFGPFTIGSPVLGIWRGLGNDGNFLPKNSLSYQSQGVTDFFQRFNITISGFGPQCLPAFAGESSNVLADCLNLILWGC